MGKDTKNQTIFRVANRQRPFSQLSNVMIRDRRLSRDARFTLIFILTFPPDWKLKQTWLAKQLDMGRDKTYRCVQELEKFGYCVRRQQRNAGGTLGPIEYYFTDEAGTINLEPVPENQEAVTQDVGPPPLPGLPYPVKPAPTNKHFTSTSQSSSTNCNKQKRARARKPALQGTDVVSAPGLPFAESVIAELTSMGVDAEALIVRYGERTKGRRITDPSAYLLKMGRDEVAKRIGVTAEQVQASNSKNRDVRIAAAADVLGAYKAPSAMALARARHCKHLDAVLAVIASRSFRSQAECDQSFEMEVTNARFRPPGVSTLSGLHAPEPSQQKDAAA